MAGAYATIANDGIYIEPTFFTKIVSNSGETVLNTPQKKRRVFSEATAYVTKKLLVQPVEGANGTATYCKIPGMEVVAKTGTTNEDYDRWLCGFTNYYTAVTWFGYDLSEPIKFDGKNPAGLIWADVMINIHEKLSNSSFNEVEKGIVKVQICRESFGISNGRCNDTYIEYFLSETEPGYCAVH